ncbi:hypothetical protein [Streptomyces sp. NPDC050145]|uniref:hypothetical protein n=1 Tax=Streptomyces sp. NPDC050145 TaxID=3365602 RepID=UPI00378D8E48
MEAVILIVVLMFVAFLALGAYATVKAVGAAKRGVDRKVEQARRAVEDTTLRARSFAQPGAASELAQLRLRLRGSMRATQDALHAGVGDDPTLQESLGLFDRLSAHGRELDADLKRLESEPDKAHLARLLPDLRARTEQITASADALRHAARDRASHFASDDLDDLSRQIDVEAGALRHWTTTTDTPQTGSTPRTGPSPHSGPTPQTGPTPRTTPAAEAAPQPGPERARPQITPSGPRPAYPWQKKPRPESTT